MPDAPPPLRPTVTPPVRTDTRQDWLRIGGETLNLALVEMVTLPAAGSPHPVTTVDLAGGRTVLFEGRDALAVAYFFAANGTELRAGGPEPGPVGPVVI